jgi:HlyD family secretion protein
MDIPRKGAARSRLIRRIIYGSIIAAAIPLITVGLSRLEPAAPTVERSTVWTDTVKRGPMTREVRGLGTLVPEEVLWIPAINDGRVERIVVLPGAEVKTGTILMVLSNPELDQAALDAEYQVKAAEAKYQDLKVQLESQYLTQQAEVARVQSEYHQAKLKADRDEVLAKEGLIPDLDLRISLATSEELANRHGIEQKRLAIQSDSVEAQMAVQRAEVDKSRALARLKRSQVESLRVRAGAVGVLQEVPVEVGQQVAAGTILAKVAQPERLKAELKIPETQAKDVQIGQKAAVDTRNGVIPARVSRIDPAVRDGTVTVDTKLEGELPQGARPDLSVDGTIELEHLEDIIFVGRPAFGQPNSTVSLFKVNPDGEGAIRVQVKLGRSSVNTIEIIEGLQPGDQVILSDMSAWDAHDRIRLD